ncbi:MAG TPA: glycoside hydrolase family 3 C-terminal domain-containing protein, partial [Bacteroidales bacterium]|nr:glycoside hydrolase family 3 C-terminal domain-containing protein [Bacteroidales bacterium]
GQGQSQVKGISRDMTLNDPKIEGIISKMTLEEKIDMLHGNGMFTSPGIERLGIPKLKYTDGPLGIREEISKNSWNSLKLTTDSATFFPAGSALAATWNPEMAYLLGTGMGEEARSRGKDILLAPAVNITRIPTGGRTFEYLSEDPFLNSRLAVGYIKGVQGQGVAACVKHFALNNQETNRGSVNIIVDDRTMREIYLAPFEAAVKEANVYTVMAAYNKIDGSWCSENDNLLNQILKKEWGFKGLVMSDWGGTHSTVKAAMNGLDVEMGSTRNAFLGQPLLDSVKAGLVPIEIINDKVKRILRVRFAVEPITPAGVVSTPEHGKIAYKVASQSIVLLKNADNLLPVDLGKIKKIAVIGDNATHKQASGGFGAGVKTRYEITPLEGLKSEVGSRASIQFARGYKPAFIWSQQVRGRRSPNNKIDSTLLAEAVSLARNSDIAIIFAGTNRDFETEGSDRSDLKLPFGQDELIRAIASVNPRTIVVLVAGAPLDLNEALKSSSAMLMSWFNGSEGGNAIADVILGNVNPSGKLPFTFPVSLNDSPAYSLATFPGDNNANYKEGSLVGYRWFETKNIKPLFSFGFGLSYTQFSYSGIKTDKGKYKSNDTIQVSMELKNTGKREGDEVVQLYVHRTDSKVEWPAKELKSFSRVTLKPGETKKVTLSVPVSQLRYWDVKSNDWQLEDGEIQLMIGSSSSDIILTKNIEI